MLLVRRMPTASQINPKQTARKGILKSPPAFQEPISKNPKVEIDLSGGKVGAEARGSNENAVVGTPPGLPGQFSEAAQVPPLPSDFGGSGSFPEFVSGGSLSNEEVNWKERGRGRERKERRERREERREGRGGRGRGRER